MGKSILITGGARSGKSRIAESWTLRLGRSPVYVATAQSDDEEMALRIADHRSRRGPEWMTVQEPLELGRALLETDGAGPRLVDCLTLWLSNLMLAQRDWSDAAHVLAETIRAQSAPVILVTNEVGGGIVPENAIARRFRDAAGAVNQLIAEAVDEVYLAVSGYPLQVKPNAHL